MTVMGWPKTPHNKHHNGKQQKVLLLLALLFPLIILTRSFTAVPTSFFSSTTGRRRLLIVNDAPPRNRVSTAATPQITDMLWDMTGYFSQMVDSTSGRFYSKSRPPCGKLIHQHGPIRDLGVTWDATTALLFWTTQKNGKSCPQEEFLLLETAVRSTIQHYNALYTSSFDAMALDADILLEPPNIAHSGLFILAFIGADRLGLMSKDETMPPVDALTRGILSRQRLQDGAFRSEFGKEHVFKGIEFYPGEAMTALMEVQYYSASVNGILEQSTKSAILPAMERAFCFYSDLYHQGQMDVNYNIWQVQAFARLYHALVLDRNMHHDNDALAPLVCNYVLELCDDICESSSWKLLARGKSFYPNLQTAEIACGLDAIVQGIPLATCIGDETRATLFWMRAENAVEYLHFIQDQVPPTAKVGRGGLGYGGIRVLEQRLDVTGHAISALTKLYQIQEKPWEHGAA